jgi:hypothetical protein
MLHRSTNIDAEGKMLTSEKKKTIYPKVKNSRRRQPSFRLHVPGSSERRLINFTQLSTRILDVFKKENLL